MDSHDLFSKVREYYYDLEKWIDRIHRCIQNVRNGSERRRSLRRLRRIDPFFAVSSAIESAKMSRTCPNVSFTCQHDDRFQLSIASRC